MGAMNQKLTIARTTLVSWTRQHAEGMAFFAVVLCMVAAEAALIYWYLRPHGYDQRKQYAQIVAAAAGGTVVIGQIYYTRRNLAATEKNIEQTRATAQESIAQAREAALKKEEIDREGQITERFTRAVEQLGSESAAIRLGGIYALERIANDSAKDHATVVHVLTSYVREHSFGATKDEIMMNNVRMRLQEPNLSAERRQQIEYEERLLMFARTRTQEDIRAILEVLGRRNVANEVSNSPGLNFSATLLDGLFFQGHFEHVGFFGATLRDLWFGGAHLEGANFNDARLQNVRFINSFLDGANFTGAHFDTVFIENTSLQYAIGLAQWHIDKCVFMGPCALPPGLHWPGEPPPGVPD
jgi:hypothetical protein